MLRSLGSRVGRSIRTMWRDEVLFLASALSFDALLAAIPLALVALAIGGYLAQSASAEEIRQALTHFTPDTAAIQRAEALLAEVIDSRGNLTAWGVPLYLLFATRLFASASVALNHILGVPRKRPFLAGIARDVFLVLTTTALFAASTFVALPEGLGLAAGIAGEMLWFVLASGIFFLVYSLAPDRPLRWDTAILMAMFCAAAVLIARLLFGAYLSHFVTIDRMITNANAVGVILFVTWVYYSALIFLIGGELGRWYERKGPGLPGWMGSLIDRRLAGDQPPA